MQAYSIGGHFQGQILTHRHQDKPQRLADRRQFFPFQTKSAPVKPKQAQHIHDDKVVSEADVSDLRLLSQDHGASNIAGLNYSS